MSTTAHRHDTGVLARRAKSGRSRATTTSRASCCWSATSPTSSRTWSTRCATTTAGCTAGALSAAYESPNTPHRVVAIASSASNPGRRSIAAATRSSCARRSASTSQHFRRCTGAGEGRRRGTAAHDRRSVCATRSAGPSRCPSCTTSAAATTRAACRTGSSSRSTSTCSSTRRSPLTSGRDPRSCEGSTSASRTRRDVRFNDVDRHLYVIAGTTLHAVDPASRTVLESHDLMSNVHALECRRTERICMRSAMTERVASRSPS